MRIATFLAPNMLPVYDYIARRLAKRLGRPTELFVGTGYEQLGTADVAFVCGLAYVELAELGAAWFEPLAAPLLQGARYGGQPVYFSDVIVRRDSPFQSFADLRGCSWSYNEPHSHSGYGVTLYRLAQLGETTSYFGRMVEASWHERSIRLVCDGSVDASAIDCQVLAVALREHPELHERLRVIDSFGPSTIQPVVAARHLPQALKEQIRAELLTLGDELEGRNQLGCGFIERFVTVDDSNYDDIRRMRAAAKSLYALSASAGRWVAFDPPPSGGARVK